MSKTEINCLATTGFKIDNKLRTKVYVKPTDRLSYLHSKSEHPNSTMKSIAYSQGLSFHKIFYHRSNLHNNCKPLLNTLTRRGYNRTDSTTQINSAIPIPRNKFLKKLEHLILNVYHLLLRITGL